MTTSDERYYLKFIDRFEEWVNNANAEGRPDSPARHFHLRTITRLGEIGLDNIFDDVLFFDYLYATLASWGMDSRGAKLWGYKQFVSNIKSNHARILTLKDENMEKAARSDDINRDAIIDNIWNALVNMNVSSGQIQLVAGSKALHHMLPDLVPPIDRKYSLYFYLRDKSIPSALDEQQSIFNAVFKGTLAVFILKHKLIEKLTKSHPSNTSITKVIDNAIIGYIKSEGK